MDWKRGCGFFGVFPAGFCFAAVFGFSVGVVRHIADILVDIGEKSFCYHSVGQHDRNLLFTCFIFSDVWILNDVLRRRSWTGFRRLRPGNTG